MSFFFVHLVFVFFSLLTGTSMSPKTSRTPVLIYLVLDGDFYLYELVFGFSVSYSYLLSMIGSLG